MQADKLVRRDVAERLNRKQKQQWRKNKKWHTNTWLKNGLNLKRVSLRNSTGNDSSNGENNQAPYAYNTLHDSTKHAN